MRYGLLFVMLASSSMFAVAQQSSNVTDPDTKSSRDAVIRSALARDNGEITAIEASTVDGKGVVIGYSSGAVVHCFAKDTCRAFDGTPSSAVTGAVKGLSLSLLEGAQVVWVAYPHGIVYRCVDYSCREFDVSTD